jgi:hypothetical protein
MTGAQADWLKQHPTYRAVSTHPPSGHTYTQRGFLHPDGSFEQLRRGQRSLRLQLGSFEVGILEQNQDLVRR